MNNLAWTLRKKKKLRQKQNLALKLLPNFPKRFEFDKVFRFKEMKILALRLSV